MAVQKEFKISPGSAKPRALSLTIDVVNMDEDGIADLRRRLDDFASEIDAELGDGLCSVKSY